MSLLVGVHGIWQQQRGRRQLLAEWGPALADGLERAVGHSVAPLPLDIAFYGHLFLPLTAADVKGSDTGLDPRGEEALLDGWDEAETAEITAAVQEVVSEADLDAAVKEAVKGLRLPLWLQRLIRALDRRFGIPAGVLYVSELRQVRRYLCSPEIKAEVDRIVAAAVTAECRILVAHSLGSVVAFEFARQHPERRLDLLLTAGSPLALTMIRDRLPYPNHQPTAVGGWVNIRDPGDPVAAAGNLRPFWPQVIEMTVHNGDDPHNIGRYLSKSVAGEAILAAVPELVG